MSRAFAQALTWANTFFVIRLVQPADFGLAALASVFANFLSLLNELGFSVALVQRQTRDMDTFRSVFGALLFLGGTLFLSLMCCAPLIAALCNESRVTPLIRIIAVQFLVMPFSVIPQARLSMDMRFRELGIVQVASAVIGGATTLVMALYGAGAVGLIVGTVALSVARALLLNIYCPSIWLPQLRIQRISGFARFSGLVLLERSLWYWYMQIDSFVVGRALGAASLGVYAVGRQVTNIPLERAMEIINSVALPTFARVKDDLSQVRAGYLKVLRVGSGYAFPVFWGLALVSEPLVRLVLGSRWIAAASVIKVLCIAMPLRMLNSFTSSAVTAVARQDVNIKSLVCAIVIMPASIVIGSRWGLLGVAAAWAVGFPVVYSINAWLIREALSLHARQMARAIWPPAISAAAMVIVVTVLRFYVLRFESPWTELAVTVPLGGSIFSGALWLVSKQAAQEIISFGRGIVGKTPNGLTP